MTNDLPVESALSTNRLVLEMVKIEDHDFIRSLVNTREWIENIGDRQVRSKKEAIAYIQRILATENFLYWVVRIKKESTPIGIISFLRRNYLQNFDIGFAFLPEFTGKGYAYEAAKAVLDMVTQQPGFNTVLALTLRTNKRSIKLLEKLGFTFVESSEMEGRRLEIFASAKRPNPN